MTLKSIQFLEDFVLYNPLKLFWNLHITTLNSPPPVIILLSDACVIPSCFLVLGFEATSDYEFK